MLLVGERTGGLTHGVEVIGFHTGLVHGLQHVVDVLRLTQCHHLQLVVMMVEHDHYLI